MHDPDTNPLSYASEESKSQRADKCRVVNDVAPW
jgi:hypothetical protein